MAGIFGWIIINFNATVIQNTSNLLALLGVSSLLLQGCFYREMAMNQPSEEILTQLDPSIFDVFSALTGSFLRNR